MLDGGSRLIGDNPGLVLSLGYLYLTGIGMAYQARFYRAFGVDILDFTDAGDFILAGVRDPIIMLLSLAPFPLAWGYLSLVRRAAEAAGRRLKRPPPREDGIMYHPLVKRLGVGIMLLTWILAFLATYGRYAAREVRKGRGTQVTVEMSAGGDSLASRTATLLGTSARYIFLHDVDTRKTDVIPFENVVRLQVTAPPPRKRGG